MFWRKRFLFLLQRLQSMDYYPAYQQNANSAIPVEISEVPEDAAL
jgi:hypothetical protein